MSAPSPKPKAVSLSEHQKKAVEHLETEIKECRPSSSSGYNFPWNLHKNMYDTSTYDPRHSNNKVATPMINSLLEDIYQIQLVDPVVFNFKILAGYVTLIFGTVMWMLYLLMGLATSYYKYEILTDGDKRYINKTPD